MQKHASAGTTPRYRPDVDGLRAIAIGSVVLFHAGFPGVGGGFVGVDIFFVISGYLITALLFAELDRTGRIDFVNFWARRTRRLLPSALLVIAVTLVAAMFVLSDLQLFFAARDSIYAALYLINWQKLFAAVDYFNDESGSGLFLHYWSLAVEEQFYIFLTLVFAAAVLLRRPLSSWQASIGAIVVTILSIAGLLSFVANVDLAVESQPEAFFGTHARIWQLCIGSAMALTERSGYVPARALRAVAAWLGLAGMLAATVLYDSELNYPGWYAVLPTLSSGLFIFAGLNGGGVSMPVPLRAVGTPLPVALGKISYALYLWHWPVFELYKASFDTWTSVDRVIALAVALALSVVSHVTVENPVRFSPWLAARPVLSLVGAILLSALVTFAALALQRVAGSSGIHLAAGTMIDPQELRLDQPVTMTNGCHVDQKDVAYAPCVFGATGSPRSIFLFGDSHAAQWFPALETLAADHGMALRSRTKSACPSIDVAVNNPRWKRPYRECAAWREAVLAEIERLRPVVVVVANSSRHQSIGADGQLLEGDARAAALREGEQRTIDRIRKAGAEVVLIADTPWLPADPVECLLRKRGHTEDCRWPASDVLKGRSPWSVDATTAPAGVRVIDFADTVCRDGFCYAATDKAATMRDRHHLAASYVSTLVPLLEERLGTALKAR